MAQSYQVIALIITMNSIHIKYRFFSAMLYNNGGKRIQLIPILTLKHIKTTELASIHIQNRKLVVNTLVKAGPDYPAVINKKSGRILLIMIIILTVLK